MVSGVLQVNLQIPTGLPSGSLPLTVTLSGNAGQSGVTITVQSAAVSTGDAESTLKA